MAVGSSAVSCAAGQGDDGALFHLLSHGHKKGGVMAVAGHKAAIVFDFYQIAIASHPAGLGYHAGGGGFDGTAVIDSNINAFMVGRSDTAGA